MDEHLLSLHKERCSMGFCFCWTWPENPNQANLGFYSRVALEVASNRVLRLCVLLLAAKARRS